MNLELIAVVLLVCAVIGAFLGSRKDIGTVGGLILGGVLGPIGLLVMLLMGDK